MEQGEIVPIEIESILADPVEHSDEHPWASFAGMDEAKPRFDEVLDAIQAYRRTVDEDESVR